MEKNLMNLNTYYKALSEIHGELFTEREFSEKYMGKCETYYGYLKCTNSEPSKSALINLWHQLRYDSNVLAEQAQRSIFTEDCMENKQQLEGLRTALLQDIMFGTSLNVQQHKLAS